MTALKYKLSATFMLFLLCSVLFPTKPVWAAIRPEEIVVIVNAGSGESLKLGELYASLRNVPSSHLIRINAPMSDNIPRKEYEELIAGPVRQAIIGLENKGVRIRCIVTTYGVPLRVDFAKPLIVPEARITQYENMSNEKSLEMEGLMKKRREVKWEMGQKLEQEKEKDMIVRDLDSKINELDLEIKRLYVEVEHLKGHDTEAALDSELALLFVPGYQLSGWLPNPDYIIGREHNKNYSGRTLMVSRLDGPTPELAEGLVRTAIEVESTGLSGKVYLDARGLKGNDAYSRFDEDIRRAAGILEKGSMPVVLDNRPEVFDSGKAPFAALYCGWYSHKRYVDAFTWSKGAVGYHVASSEAVSLHQPNREYWVKKMIEKGVIGSIGPVAEPYLTSFPSPSLFFPLFMSGEYTLAEVYAMSNPFLSWQMILVGDPLYNPFRKGPAFIIENPPPPPD